MYNLNQLKIEVSILGIEPREVLLIYKLWSITCLLYCLANIIFLVWIYIRRL